MARLPKPGGDAGNWGEILNHFLRQEHNDDGSLKDVARTADVAAKADATRVDALTPGPCEVIVGGTNGPVATPTHSIGRPSYRAETARITTMLTSFQAGHGFTKLNGAASSTVVGDTTIYTLGSQSLRVTANNVTPTVARRTGVGTFDTTNKDIVVWVRVDDPTNLAEVTLYLSSNNFAGFAYHTLEAASPPLHYLIANEWTKLVIPQAVFIASGTVNWAAVTDVQVRVLSKANMVTVHWGGIALADRATSGVISFTFDDGYESQYTRGRKVLSQYGMPATAYLITDLIGNSGFLDLAQCHELEEVHGWEMASHAGTLAAHNTRYPNLTEDEIGADFALCRDWMIRNGFGTGADHFCYPDGAYDSKTLRQARRYFASARSTNERRRETLPPGDPHRLYTYNTSNTRTPATINSAIDAAMEGKQWIILVFHYIVADGRTTGATTYGESDFAAIVAHVAANGYTVRTVGDVIRNGLM